MQKMRKQVIKIRISRLIKDKIYIVFLLLIFTKSIIFTSLLGTSKAATINMATGFFSVPPYLVYMAFAMMVLSFSFLFKARAHIYSMIAIDFLISLLLLANVWCYRLNSGFLNMFMIYKHPSLSSIASSIISVVNPIDIIFIFDIILIIVYMAYNKELCKGVRRNYPVFILTLCIPCLYITYDHFKVDTFQRGFFGQTVFVQSWAPTQTMSNLGPIGYQMYDVYNYYANSKKYELTEKDKTDIKTWYDENDENLPDNVYAGMFKGKNVIVIQVESLENFVINQKIEGKEITPNLNKLLKNSLYFDNYHENVNNGVSSDSDLLTNTGVYPVRLGSTFFRYPINSYPNSLPNILKNEGYSTLAIHPDKGSYWNWVQALKSIGFENCYDSTHFKSTEPIGLGLSDQELFSQVAKIVESNKSPFYTFMVTQSSHGPFDLPKQYRELNLSDDIENSILGDYLESIHYTDKAIGNFISELDQKGILNNTMLVIYGDHTGVHKFYQDELNKVASSDDWWKKPDMKIPLIIYNPSTTGKTFDVQSGQIDVMPTISYLMGVDKKLYEKEALGKVLVNTNKNYTILENFQMLGQYTSKDAEHAKEGIILSDKMVRSNYFKDNSK